MATAAKALKYPQRLTEHLKHLSVEKADECKMSQEWTFSHTEDSGEAGSDCPCGKTGIRHLCYIREVKHDVYGKRQTAKIILILRTFSLALK